MVERSRITSEVANDNIVTPIDDNNYLEFLEKNPLAVLVVAESWCSHCQDYKPTVSQLAEALPKVRFGIAYLDKSLHTKPWYRNQNGTHINSIPTTLMFREGKAIGLFSGDYPFGDAMGCLTKYLIQGQPILPDDFLVKVFGEEETHGKNLHNGNRGKLPSEQTEQTEQTVALIKALDNALAKAREEKNAPPTSSKKPNLFARFLRALRF